MSELQSQLETQLETLAGDGYCASAYDTAFDLRSLLLPPEQVSTTECAEKYRFLRDREGTGKRRWKLALTPYVGGIQDALDDAVHRFVVVVGPGRAGKSVGGENHLFKRLRNGPLTDTIIYLQAESDVSSYADKEFGDFFTLHPEISAKLGKAPSDRKRDFKRVSGRAIQLLPANPGNIRQKEATYIFATELDGYRKTVRDGFKDNIAVRMQASGNQAKAYIESHPDMGWTGGVATIWKDSTRGLWFWPCSECGDFSCPHPLAPKGMYMPLVYEALHAPHSVRSVRDPSEKADEDALLDRVEATAKLLCPHCGGLIDDDGKNQMLAGGKWVFSGQTIARDGTVLGDPRVSDAAGFWIHGTMSPFVRLGELARSYVGALRFFENTRKSQRLKEVTVKRLGEVYEGAGAGSGVIDPRKLAERAANDDGFPIGTAPPGVLFVTAAVDVGGTKFDVLIVGWDLEGRAWFIDRYTLRQNRDGRELRPRERRDDWLVLRDRVLRHLVPLTDDPSMGLPVAGMAIDVGDGNVTAMGREFARQMRRANESGVNGYRIRLVKGGSSAKAPEVSPGREINKDDKGRPVTPSVLEFTLNVDKLKTLSVERALVEDDEPGCVRFADGLPGAVFTELGGEVQIDGKWERRGDNETLDLFGYNEVVRQLLQPERKTIRWDVARPSWARPVPINDNDETGGKQGTSPDPAPTKPNKLDRLARLNRR